MRIWPFGNKLENRDDSYTDTLIAALVSRLQGNTLANVSATGALEACAGLVGRAFMAAEIDGRPALTTALTPDCLELIGRSLIRRGEVVFLISTESGDLELLPAETHDVSGGPTPESWEYRLTVAGPSRTFTYPYVPYSSVLHFRYAIDSSTPWKGNSPLGVAALAGKLSAETVLALANEASGPVGRLLGIPKDGNDDTIASLKADIRDAKGRTLLMESGDWDAVGGGGVDLESKRFGPEPPTALIEQADLASREVIAACGLNGALWHGAQAASVREAWRLALFGVVAPLGRKVQRELNDKLDGDVTVGWQELRASDLERTGACIPVNGRWWHVDSGRGSGVRVDGTRLAVGVYSVSLRTISVMSPT